LKLLHNMTVMQIAKVAPRAGAWIETPSNYVSAE